MFTIWLPVCLRIRFSTKASHKHLNSDRQTQTETMWQERKKNPDKKIDKICVLSAEKKAKTEASNDVLSACKKITGTNRNNIRKMAFSQATTTTTTTRTKFERSAKKEYHYLVCRVVEHFRWKTRKYIGIYFALLSRYAKKNCNFPFVSIHLPIRL